MANRLQIRRDTAANWTSANPTLAQGEFGYELDTFKIKIGDGSTVWTSLAYRFSDTGITQLTGDVTAGPGSGSQAASVVSVGGASASAIATVVANTSGTNTGDQTITLTGDVTGSGTGSFAATIANDAVTFAKMQNINTNKLLGRSTASSGDVEEIAIGAGLVLTAGTLTNNAISLDLVSYTYFGGF